MQKDVSVDENFFEMFISKEKEKNDYDWDEYLQRDLWNIYIYMFVNLLVWNKILRYMFLKMLWLFVCLIRVPIFFHL